MLHSYTRIAGYGLTVLPFVPFRAARSGRDLDVEVRAPAGFLFARVIPFEGGYKSKVGPGTDSLHQVVEMGAGPVSGDWRVETGIYSCAWPEGFDVVSPDSESDPVPFDLVAPNGASLYIQNAGKAPPLADLGAPGQTRAALGSTFVEFTYQIQGLPWRQRHERVDLEGHPFMISLQAPEAAFDAARPALGRVRETFERTGGP